MRKTLLVILTILFMASMLSGCFYNPYWNDWGGRGYRHDRGYHDDRGYGGQRDGYRDSRERR